MTRADPTTRADADRPGLGVLLRNRVSVVWGVLIGATVVSWWLGARHGVPSRLGASVLIVLVAAIKVRLVGLYFMDLRDAPLPLRAVFEIYCLVLTGACIGMLLFA